MPEYVKTALNAGIYYKNCNIFYNKTYITIILALQELGATYADLFLISWPSGINMDDGKALWSAMECVFNEEKAHSLGVSDVETQAFVELHNAARIKPEAIQINFESCCVVPPELVTFTRENNIQLLTHNDPQNILPTETLKTIVPSLEGVLWTVRYQTLLRCRGIIKNKGYVISTHVAWIQQGSYLLSLLKTVVPFCISILFSTFKFSYCIYMYTKNEENLLYYGVIDYSLFLMLVMHNHRLNFVLRSLDA